MSGFAGILRLDGREVVYEIDLLTDSLIRRGRDGRGVWRDGAAGLAHCASHTTPEARLERQPLVARGLVVTADARLDNRAELAALLGLAPDACDVDFILAAYETWGDDCAGRLVGDFAFAVWDERRRVLFCARDAMGGRPFCYHASEGFFAFASDVATLLALDEVPRHLDETTIADYLSGRPEEASGTFYTGIRRLPPAHTLTVDGAGVRIREYWRLDPSRDVRFRRDEEYEEAFRELFVEAVRCRLRASSDIGMTLSGGLDSSSVAATARHVGGGPLHAFSWRFDEVPECDERDFAGAVIAQGGIESHLVDGDERSPLGELDSVSRDSDGPDRIQNMFLWRATYDAARTLGIRVMLDGHDGDSVVWHGAGYLDELARRGRWIALAREARFVASRRGGAALPILEDQAKRHLMLPVWKRWRKLRGRPVSSSARLNILNPDLARRVGPRADRPVQASTTRQAHHDQLLSGFLRYATEAIDATGAHYGIEPRHPFLDRRLVEFCLALPPDQKLWQGWGRGVLRRAMKGVLPEEVRWRVGKTRLGAQFNRAILKDRALLDDAIVNDPGALGEYVNLEALRAAYRLYLASGEKAAGVAVWNAVTLRAWLQSSTAKRPRAPRI
jgi:asparagine synthase (glutamine-hydrolysing)